MRFIGLSLEPPTESFRNGPQGEPENDPLDSSFSTMSDDNRWNRRGEPSLYLAGDVGVAAGEWARHVARVTLAPEIEKQAHLGSRPDA